MSDGGSLRGSAVKISGADPTIENCIIKNCVLTNTAYGAVSFHSTASTVKNTVFYGTTGGPAIYIDNEGDNSSMISMSSSMNQENEDDPF